MERTRLNDATLFAHMRRCAGFSLIELLIVVTIMGILAGVILPQLTPNITEQLEASAQILAADISYARSLAVSNNSTYQITFDRVENQYVLQHSGSNSALATLPHSPFQSPASSLDKHITDLDEAPQNGPKVKLYIAYRIVGAKEIVGDLEFNPLGGTTRAAPTIVWLSCGAKSTLRFLSVEIHPVTGLTEIGEIQATQP